MIYNNLSRDKTLCAVHAMIPDTSSTLQVFSPGLSTEVQEHQLIGPLQLGAPLCYLRIPGNTSVKPSLVICTSAVVVPA